MDQQGINYLTLELNKFRKPVHIAGQHAAVHDQPVPDDSHYPNHSHYVICPRKKKKIETFILHSKQQHDFSFS